MRSFIPSTAKGGSEPYLLDAASCTNGGDEQIVAFAKLGGLCKWVFAQYPDDAVLDPQVLIWWLVWKINPTTCNG